MNPVQQKLAALIEIGAWIQARGWCPATSGNLSINHGDAASFHITCSGKYKGELSSADFLQVDYHGQVLAGEGKPSAETLLHGLVYQLFPDTACVLHGHSIYGTVLSRAIGDGELVFDGFELQKAFAGVTTHEGQLSFPVFANHQDMTVLADQIRSRFATGEPVYGFLLAGHGAYTWGNTLADAKRHLEALEFLLECEYRARLLAG
jgi:methylthioribulose-1-phosphate dehydratase